MSVSIASPQSGETVNGLSLSVSVSYSTTVTFSLPVPPPSSDPPSPLPPPPPPPSAITWRLSCEVSGQPVQTRDVPPGEGNQLFSFLLPSAADYTVRARLESVSAGGTATPSGSDEQTPIHVTNSSASGVIIVLPPPPPPPPPPPVQAGGESAKSGTPVTKKLSVASESSPTPCPPCPTPFVLTGTYPSLAADPTTGMVVQIYHIHNGNELIDYVSVPLLVGSALAAGGGSGSIVVGNTFSTVFPPDARLPGRHFRLYLTGVLGKILYSTSGAVPP